MSTIELKNTSAARTNWMGDLPLETTYHCDICLIREEDGSFSAIVLNLPGAGSCGATREEAMRNVREAILGVIESYAEAGQEIPWRDSTSDDVPEGARRRWILMNA